MTPIELHAALTHTLALLEQQRVADPHGFAFGPLRPLNGYRPIPRLAPTVPAFQTPRTPGFGTSGWNFGQGGGLPPDVRIGVQGLRNWVPYHPPPVNG